MTPGPATTVEPSAHVRSLAGIDLPELPPPAVRVGEAREVAVVLSRSRDPDREVFLERCALDRVPVVVRPSGGGAVVLAHGVVTASVLDAAQAGDRFPESHFRRFCGATAHALVACGVRGISRRGVSDLCLGDRKIAGSSIRLWEGRVLFQVSILVALDLGILERYLRHPSREPDYRRGRTHREFVVSLREAGFSVTVDEVVAGLHARLEREVKAPRSA